jgi:hypothetical protein
MTSQIISARDFISFALLTAINPAVRPNAKGAANEDGEEEEKRRAHCGGTATSALLDLSKAAGDSAV